MGAALGEDFLDALVLAKRLGLADKLDGESGLRSQPFCIEAQLFAEGVGPLREIEQADVVRAEIALHSFGMTDVG